jgi:hypothetical protein
MVTSYKGRELVDRPSERERDTPVLKPEACPACGSRAVGTLAKVITVDTYWRCQGCGEIWNPARVSRANHRPSRSW